MTDRLFTLAEITEVMGPAYAESLREPTVERAMILFTQRTIDALKALPATEHELRRIAAREEVLSMFDGPAK